MTSSGKPGLQSLRSRVARLAAGCLLAVDAAGATPPSFADLEAAGARIGQVRVLTRDIFDTDDPREDRLPFRWANALHGVVVLFVQIGALSPETQYPCGFPAGATLAR